MFAAPAAIGSGKCASCEQIVVNGPAKKQRQMPQTPLRAISTQWYSRDVLMET